MLAKLWKTLNTPLIELVKGDPQPPAGKIATANNDITKGFVGGLGYILPEDPILRDKGGFNYEIYERVLRDDQVHACFQQRIKSHTMRRWDVQSADDRRDSKKAAEFIRQQLDRIHFDNLTEKMLYGILLGFAVAEIEYEPEGDYLVWKAITVQKQERFRFDPDGNLLFRSWDSYLGQPVPDRKFWFFSTGGWHDSDPYGLGLAYHLYFPVLFKTNTMKFWVTYSELFGNPGLIGKYFPNATQEQQDKLLEALQAFRRNFATIIPEGMSIEMLEAQRVSTAGLYESLYDKMDKAIAKIILSQTMTTEEGSSYAQAVVHGSVKDAIVQADCDLICDSFNHSCVRWLIDFNRSHFPTAGYPMVWRESTNKPDQKMEADKDKILFDMGFRLTQGRVDEIYGEGQYQDLRARSEGDAAVALDSSQVQSLIQLATAAASGQMSNQAGMAIAEAAFPMVPSEVIQRIFAEQPKSDSGAVEANPELPSLDQLQFSEVEFAGRKKCSLGVACGNACISMIFICRKDLAQKNKAKLEPARAAIEGEIATAERKLSSVSSNLELINRANANLSNVSPEERKALAKLGVTAQTDPSQKARLKRDLQAQKQGLEAEIERLKGGGEPKQLTESKPSFDRNKPMSREEVYSPLNAQEMAILRSTLDPPDSIAGNLSRARQDLTSGPTAAKEVLRKLQSEGIAKDMTVTEVQAIRAYTGSAYAGINGALRGMQEDPTSNLAERQRLLARQVNQAIQKLPAYQGEVYRGTSLPKSELAKYKEGEVVSFSGLSSTTTDLGTAKEYRAKQPISKASNYAELAQRGGIKISSKSEEYESVEFKIQSKSGRDISSISSRSFEKEVLLPHGWQGKVTKRETVNGKLVISLEEVDMQLNRVEGLEIELAEDEEMLPIGTDQDTEDAYFAMRLDDDLFVEVVNGIG